MSGNDGATFRKSRATLITSAKNILERKEAAKPDDVLELAMKLKNIGEFGYARKLLARARRAVINDPILSVKLRHEYALCTYKDWNLPLDERLDRALEILSEDDDEDLGTTRNQVTLGLAGDIYKQKWKTTSRKQFLEHALSYYMRGYNEDPTYDLGYTATRAASVLDLLSCLEADEAGHTHANSSAADCGTAAERRAQARRIRQHLVEVLTGLLKREEYKWLQEDWEVHARIAEAYFGLADYEQAREWFIKVRELGPEGWQPESIGRQLSLMAYLQHKVTGADTAAAQAGAGATISWAELEQTPAASVIKDFLGESAAGVRSLLIGKVGIALAGGGVRASLFHIGMLAKLAELDMLRHVEVISCSSGGSIVGAHYYLEVRKLLQSKPDGEITREDYIQLVQRLERDFLAGAQRNIRMRSIASLTAGLKAVFQRTYSRSERVGDLLETEIYSRVKDGEEDKQRYLTDLYVYPLGAPRDFTPKRDNWQRAAKVPILMLNATTLNTGHNWQFTASWMGETPTTINSETDANDYLRPMYYDEAPSPYSRMRLGQAVAASTCIPGLLEPMVFADLYPDMTIRLVDGGVHGCQGVTALLEQDCEVLLIADASGEAETQNQPGNGVIEVPSRAANILLARVRAAQYDDLKAREQAQIIRSLMYVHLTKDLDGGPVGCLPDYDPKDTDDDARPSIRRGPLTRYGIRKDVQASLASIRTDLDSFSDVEAFALMTSSYRMTEYEFANCIGGSSETWQSSRPPWRFLAIEEPMKRSGSVDLIYGTLQLLKVANNRGFKVWRLSRLAQWFTILLGVIATALLSYLTYRLWSLPLTVLTAGKLLTFVVTVCSLLLLMKIILVAQKIPKTLTDIAIDIGLSLSGFFAARIYLFVFDALYLRLGGVRDSAREAPVTAEPATEKVLIASSLEDSALPAATPSVGSRIKQVTHIRAVGDFIDQKILDESDPTTKRFADRNLLVEAVGKMLEVGGYEVIRFPRARNLNPLNVNLDLIARKKSCYFCIEVKQSGDEGKATVDWKCALELEVATRALKVENEKQRPELQSREATEPESFGARLILVDTKPDPTLENFVEEREVKLVSYTSEQMTRVHEQASSFLALAAESASKGPEEQEASRIERGRLREKLRPVLESLTGVSGETLMQEAEEGTQGAVA